MSQSFSNNFVGLDDKYYRSRDALPSFQISSQTARVAVSNSTTAPFYYRSERTDYQEPVTSTSLSSYKGYSPLKIEPAPNTLDTLKRLVQVAIQKRWTKQTVDSNWQQFTAAFTHYDSKVELDCFFKSVNIKPLKNRPKSEPKKKQQIKDDTQKVERVDRHMPPSFHRQFSYNYEPVHRQPVKTLVKSKSDHFKLPTSKVEHFETHKPGQSRQIKMLKLCEDIEAGLTKANKILTTRGMPY